MNEAAQKILSDALHLPDRERAELAASLIDSLDPSVDEEYQQAWDSEVLRRVEELDNGAVTPVPWAEARRRILGTPHASDDP